MDKRTIKIQVRFTEEENKKLRKRAQKANRTMSAFIREESLNGAVKDYSELIKIRYQILKIGNNVNQATRMMNQYFDFTDKDFNYINDEIAKLKAIVNEAFKK